MGWLLILIRSTKVWNVFASEDRKGGSTDKYLLSADGKPLGKMRKCPPAVIGLGGTVTYCAKHSKGTITDGGASSSSNGRSLSIVKWKGETLTQGIEGDILMIADLYGDWREEIITALPGEIRIYTTNLPAKRPSHHIDARRNI